MIFNTDHTIDYNNIILSKHKKKQIILAHTSSTIDDYLVKVKTRFNGKYNKIPAYVIGLDGVIYELFSPQYQSTFMEDESVDKMSISVVLENVGWLIKGEGSLLYDWKGQIYTGNYCNVDWRQKKIWALYGDEQMVSLIQLISNLSEKFNISKDFVGDNTIISKPKTFKGVLNRSNYSKIHYDLSPAFDFNQLNNNKK